MNLTRICGLKAALLAFYKFGKVRDREEGWGKTNID
jgi:hypothetical protein